jgi:hypothetical protein
MTAPRGVSFPGHGYVVPKGGFTVREDGLQVVTTLLRLTPKQSVYTTAIYPPDTGNVVNVFRTGKFKFEFRKLEENGTPIRPYYIAVTDDRFEAGCNHQRVVHMEMTTGELPGPTAWERLMEDEEQATELDA